MKNTSLPLSLIYGLYEKLSIYFYIVGGHLRPTLKFSPIAILSPGPTRILTPCVYSESLRTGYVTSDRVQRLVTRVLGATGQTQEDANLLPISNILYQ